MKEKISPSKFIHYLIKLVSKKGGLFAESNKLFFLSEKTKRASDCSFKPKSVQL